MNRDLAVMLSLALAGAAVGYGFASRKADSAPLDSRPEKVATAPATSAYAIRLPFPGLGPDRMRSIANGEQLFFSSGCWRCHRLGARELPGGQDEGNLGPDLSAAGRRLSPEAIFESIINPSRVIAAPESLHALQGVSKMPPFPDLKLAELLDLTLFLSTDPGAPVPAAVGRHGP